MHASSSANSLRATLVRRGVQASCWMVALYSVAIVAGWALQTPALLLAPYERATNLNTALGLLLCAGGGLLFIHGRNRAALACGAAAAAIGAATLFEYAFRTDLGIDALLVREALADLYTQRLRMPPNAAFCLLLVGGALAVGAWWPKLQRDARLADAQATVALALSLVPLFGYATGFKTAYAWGGETAMTFQTALCFALVSASAMIALAQRRRPGGGAQASVECARVGTAGGLIFLLIWQALEADQRATTDALARRVADTARESFERRIESEFAAARETLDQYFVQRPGDESLWRESVRPTLRIFPTIQALLLVDPARQRRWLAGRPPSPAALAQMASLAEEPRDGGGPAIVEASGAYHTTAFGGATLVSLHDISPIGRAAPNQEQSMFRAYVQLDPRAAAPLRPEDEITLTETFRVEGLLRAAQVVVSLTPYGRASLRSPMPEITLAIGLLCTLGAVGLVLLSFRQRRLTAFAQAALAESERNSSRVRAAFASAVSGLIIIDGRGRIATCNQRAREMFGYTEAEMIGLPFEKIAPDALGPEASQPDGYARSEAAREMGTLRQRYGVAKSGALIPVEVGLNPFETPEGGFLMASVLDITDRLERERELETKNKEMEHMLYIASHDLKAPLSSIQGFIRLLFDQKAVAEPKSVAILQQIERSARQMAFLIDDLLELARAGRLTENIEVVDLGEVVDEAREILRAKSDALRCRWRILRPLPTVRANRRHVLQLVQNLASNALDYGCAGSRGVVEIGPAERPGYTGFYVRDFGPGIPKEQQGAVFEIFTRLDRSRSGTGIGLAIVSKILAAYGGRVELESEPGKGARFDALFPLSAAGDPWQARGEAAPDPEPRAAAPAEAEPAEPALRREFYELAANDPRVFEFIKDRVVDAMWARDLERPGPEWVSKRFWRLLGHDPSAAATLPASRAEFAEPEDLAAAEASLARHLANPDSHYEQTIRYRRIDGSTAWIRSLGFALRDAAGKPTRIIGFDTDVTASMRGDMLSGANGYLKDFVYAAAHDLRSPLITISGHLDYVRTRAGEGLEARLRVMLERSIEAAKQMTEYLDTLVRFSDVMQTTPNREHFESLVALEEVLAELRQEIESSGTFVESGALPRIFADRGVFKILLRELLGNAIKFRDRSRDAAARIEAEEDEREWRFAISDNGLGVPPSERKTIFNPFKKLHPHDAYPGSGIGLTICQMIVESHGGSIWIDPQAPRGATFRFTIAKPKST